MSGEGLPTRADRLFEGGKDWYFNACVDFKFHHSGKENAYIRGYKLAADALCEKVMSEDRSSVDVVIYPIVFNYRHYLELSLKATLYWGLAVLVKGKDSQGGHGLLNIWHKVHPLMVQRWPAGDPEVLASVGRLVSEFDAVDPRSTAFRYFHHAATQKQPAITRDTEAVTHINVRNFYEVMGRLDCFFDGVLTQLQVDWDSMCEAREIEEELRREYEAEWQEIMYDDYSGY